MLRDSGDIHQQIRDAMVLKGISQNKLAPRCFLSQAALSLLFKRRSGITIGRLRSIAKAMDMEVTIVLHDIGDDPFTGPKPFHRETLSEKFEHIVPGRRRNKGERKGKLSKKTLAEIEKRLGRQPLFTKNETPPA